MADAFISSACGRLTPGASRPPPRRLRLRPRGLTRSSRRAPVRSARISPRSDNHLLFFWTNEKSAGVRAMPRRGVHAEATRRRLRATTRGCKTQTMGYVKGSVWKALKPSFYRHRIFPDSERITNPHKGLSERRSARVRSGCISPRLASGW